MFRTGLLHILSKPIFQAMIVFSAILAVATPIYEQVDDVWMLRMMSGSYTGEPSSYAYYLNIVLSSLMAQLFRMHSGINWYTLFLYGSLFLSFYAICIVFSRIKHVVLFSIPSALVTILIYGYAMTHIQYVLIAGLCAVSGMVLILNAWHRSVPMRREYIVAFVLIVISYMLRERATDFILLLALPIAAHAFPRIQKGHKRLAKVFIVTTGVTLVVLYAVQMVAYNLNPQFVTEKPWNDLQGNVSAYQIYNYRLHPDIYQSVGWSENDYQMFDSTSYEDPNVFSFSDLRRIVHDSIRQLPTTKQLEYFRAIAFFNVSQTGGMYLLTAYILFAGYLVWFNKERKLLLISFALFIGGYTYYSYLIRIMPYRVTLPIALFFTVYPLIFSEENRKPSLKKKLGLYGIFVTSFLVLAIKEGYREVQLNEERIRRFQKVLTMIPKKDTAVVYLWNTSIPFYWTSPFDSTVGLKEYAFISGGWPQRLTPDRRVYEQYGVKNIYQDFLTKDNLLMIANDERLLLYKKYMDEHYKITVGFHVLRDYSSYELEKDRYGFGGKLVKPYRIY